jgi:hypothetical protein
MEGNTMFSSFNRKFFAVPLIIAMIGLSSLVLVPSNEAHAACRSGWYEAGTVQNNSSMTVFVWNGNAWYGIPPNANSYDHLSGFGVCPDVDLVTMDRNWFYMYGGGYPWTQPLSKQAWRGGDVHGLRNTIQPVRCSDYQGSVWCK